MVEKGTEDEPVGYAVNRDDPDKGSLAGYICVATVVGLAFCGLAAVAPLLTGALFPLSLGVIWLVTAGATSDGDPFLMLMVMVSMPLQYTAYGVVLHWARQRGAKDRVLRWLVVGHGVVGVVYAIIYMVRG